MCARAHTHTHSHTHTHPHTRTRTHAHTHPSRYCAPEQLEGPGDYSAAVDMYPLGLILLELCCVLSTGEVRRLAVVPRECWRLQPCLGSS